VESPSVLLWQAAEAEILLARSNQWATSLLEAQLMPYNRRDYGWAYKNVKLQKARAVRLGLRLAQNTLTTRQWLDCLIAQGWRCAYCGKPHLEHVEELTMDHVIPLSRGGANTIENIVPACRACNRSKGTGDTPVRPNFLTDEI
jgi:5-methylcytosine-specific restriction endonuclease McrA